MRYLIICTLPKSEKEIRDVVGEVKEHAGAAEVMYTEDLKLNGCTGCNDCWLKTPGSCSIKDDYEQILIKMLQVGRVIFVTETRLGFFSHKMKQLFDRALPLNVIYLKYSNGRMRRVLRYKKRTDMGILYTGEGDQTFLNHWLDQAMLNFNAKSLGAYSFGQRKEFYHALSHH